MTYKSDANYPSFPQQQWPSSYEVPSPVSSPSGGTGPSYTKGSEGAVAAGIATIAKGVLIKEAVFLSEVQVRQALLNGSLGRVWDANATLAETADKAKKSQCMEANVNILVALIKNKIPPETLGAFLAEKKIKENGWLLTKKTIPNTKPPITIAQYVVNTYKTKIEDFYKKYVKAPTAPAFTAVPSSPAAGKTSVIGMGVLGAPQQSLLEGDRPRSISLANKVAEKMSTLGTDGLLVNTQDFTDGRKLNFYQFRHDGQDYIAWVTQDKEATPIYVGVQLKENFFSDDIGERQHNRMTIGLGPTAGEVRCEERKEFFFEVMESAIDQAPPDKEIVTKLREGSLNSDWEKNVTMAQEAQQEVERLRAQGIGGDEKKILELNQKIQRCAAANARIILALAYRGASASELGGFLKQMKVGQMGGLLKTRVPTIPPKTLYQYLEERYRASGGVNNLYAQKEKISGSPTQQAGSVQMAQQQKGVATFQQIVDLYDPGCSPTRNKRNLDLYLKSDDFKRHCTTAKIYYNGQQLSSGDALRVVYQREPVNITMNQFYDKEKCKNLLGYEQSVFNAHAKKADGTDFAEAPNTASVYSETFLWNPPGGKEKKEVAVFSLPSPALDSPDQPHYAYYVKEGNLDKDKYAQEMALLFSSTEAAVRENQKTAFGGQGIKRIIIPRFGQGAFLKALSDPDQESAKAIFNSQYQAFVNRMKDVPLPIFQSVYDPTKDIPTPGASVIQGDIVQNAQQGDFIVNAWDPHSAPGNGNDKDRSFDGAMGMSSGILLTQTAWLNPNLKDAKTLRPVVSSSVQQSTSPLASFAKPVVTAPSTAKSSVGKPAAVSTTALSQEKAKIAKLPDRSSFTSLAYHTEAQIISDGGLLLTKNRGVAGGEFIGIAAMPDPSVQGGYRLNLCPGGGYLSFTDDQIEILMDEAVKTVVEKRMQITSIERNVGRHTNLGSFNRWKEKQKALP